MTRPPCISSSTRRQASKPEQGAAHGPAGGPRGGSLVLPPRPGWRDLAGRCWHARPQPPARHQPTRHPNRPSAGEVHAWPTSLALSLAAGALLACHGVHRPPDPRAGQTARPGNRKGRDHDRGHRGFAGNLTDQPELRHTQAGIARAMFRVAVSGRREQEPSFLHRGGLAGPGRARRVVPLEGHRG
jgi:hypothetical protein